MDDPNLRLLEPGTVRAAADALVEVGAEPINLRPQLGRVVIRSPHAAAMHTEIYTGAQ